MENKIYLVMYSFYSDWQIYGYFTDRDKADKYCLEHKNQELYVKEVDSFDELTGDFLKITPKYEYTFIFVLNENTGKWELDERYKLEEYQSEYTCYNEPFLRSNMVYSNGAATTWIRFYVNIGERNFEKAKKIALDLFYQFQAMFGISTIYHTKDINSFNLILNKEERERKIKEKEEKLRKKELAMLAELKAKYENN